MNTYRIQSYLLLLLAYVWITGCATNPVKGWTMVSSTDIVGPDGIDKHTYQKYKAVMDDYDDFIKKAEPKHEVWYVGNISIYENQTGRHAAMVTVETGPRRYTNYFLMYDKSDTRTKVIKGGTWMQFHM